MRLNGWLQPTLLALLVFAGTATTAVAAPIPIGVLSYDEFIVDTTAAFNLANLTGDPAAGGFALPPDLPVVTDLTLTGATLSLTDEHGVETSVPLGDLTPGVLLDASGDPLFALQFPLSTRFVSARLTASIVGAPFLLDDGSVFVPAATQIITDLLPLAGDVLTVGDFALITVDGRAIQPIPEPGTGTLLVGAGFCALARRAMRHRRSLNG